VACCFALSRSRSFASSFRCINRMDLNVEESDDDMSLSLSLCMCVCVYLSIYLCGCCHFPLCTHLRNRGSLKHATDDLTEAYGGDWRSGHTLVNLCKWTKKKKISFRTEKRNTIQQYIRTRARA
jgi:hypothetical protein